MNEPCQGHLPPKHEVLSNLDYDTLHTPIHLHPFQKRCQAELTTWLQESTPPRKRPQPSACRIPVIPGYRTHSELGRGGMGVVYEAKQLSTNRDVAIKLLLQGEWADEDELARFRNESESGSLLHHENIVEVYEVGRAGDYPFISMELLRGGSLAHRLQGTPLPANHAVQVSRILAHACGYAHSQGIVHRDLKPSNVMVSPDGVIKIGDFGLAKRLGLEAGLTYSGAILGTPHYMSPEQADGNSKRAGPTADVYSLGAILFELLAGRPPFVGSGFDVLLKVLHDRPEPPLRNSSPLNDICLKCLEKDPAKRFASALVLANDLDRFFPE